MENASKALIIAAAILLSILIIALGMRVYNSSSSVTEGVDLTSQEINAFNSTFKEYEGKQKGSIVEELITKIQSSNSIYDDRKVSIALSTTTSRDAHLSEPGLTDVIVRLDGADSNISSLRTNLKDNSTYNVKFGVKENGLINKVWIWLSN